MIRMNEHMFKSICYEAYLIGKNDGWEENFNEWFNTIVDHHNKEGDKE